jgi:hypothetical protein
MGKVYAESRLESTYTSVYMVNKLSRNVRQTAGLCYWYSSTVIR